MQEINLKLTIEEINVVLESLGNMPFKAVYPVISRVQQQVSGQLQENGVSPKEEGKT